MKGAIALSNHTVQEDTLTATTRVRGEIAKLVVGSKKRVKVDRAAIELRSKNPAEQRRAPDRPRRRGARRRHDRRLQAEVHDRAQHLRALRHLCQDADRQRRSRLQEEVRPPSSGWQARRSTPRSSGKSSGMARRTRTRRSTRHTVIVKDFGQHLSSAKSCIKRTARRVTMHAVSDWAPTKVGRPEARTWTSTAAGPRLTALSCQLSAFSCQLSAEKYGLPARRELMTEN